MRRSILLTALVLGAPAAWAQEAETLPPETGVAVEQTTETDGPAGTGGTEAVGETDLETAIDPETDVVEDETGAGTDAVEDGTGTDVVEGETDAGADVVEDDAGADVVDERHDNRSPRGALRGGHHGTVSTLARAGLGPVFGKLRSQGYGAVGIEQVDGQILVSAERQGEVRHLVYDATTGALVSDVSQASSGGIVAAIASRLKPATDPRGKVSGKPRADSRGSGKGEGGEKGGSKSSKGSGGTSGKDSKGGDKGSGGGKGNGAGKGNGGGRNK